jgi:phage baseplate assembly protein gpV
VTTFVGLMSEVARRELASQRTLGLGVVTAVNTNDGGGGEHHLDCDVRLHGSELVLHNAPVAVGRVGLSAAPRKGDLVVVGFVDGDVNGPVVLGGLYADGSPPPDAAPDEVVYEVPDDGGSVRRVEIKLPNGNRLTVKDSLVEVVMGATKLTVEGDGAITLEAASDISLKANGSLTLEAATTATLKGVSVTVEGSGSATLKGATTAIAGITSFRAG